MKKTASLDMDRHEALLADVLDALRDSAPVTEARNYVDRLERRQAKWQALRDWLWPRALSASLCTAAAIFFIAFFMRSSPAPQTIASLVGERKEIALADGSHVTLDTDSAVSIDLAGKERRLILLRGRARFAVAHDPQRPFRVTSGMMTVTALGTDFDVSIIGGQRSVTLVQGRVSVEAAILPGRTKPQAAVLSPGEQLTVTARGLMARPQAIDPVTTTAWREGRLDFTNITVADAIAQANRYSTQKIRLANSALGSSLLEGSFKVGQTAAFANALCSFLDIRIIKRTEKELVLGE